MAETPTIYWDVVALTFHPSDLVSVGSLVVLEGLLSADNALVLALLVRHLRAKEQESALWWGLAIAFGLRSIGIALASVLIGLWWVCGLGSLYLIFLTTKHFWAKRKGGHDDHGDEESKPAKGGGYWATVGQICITDLFFAIDSILVAVALVNSPDKIWIVYLGGFLGILLLRIAAQALIGLIRRYPALDNVAYLLVGWAGVKLGFAAAHIYGMTHGTDVPEMPKWLFWGVFAVIIIFGVGNALRHGTVGSTESKQDES